MEIIQFVLNILCAGVVDNKQSGSNTPGGYGKAPNPPLIVGILIGIFISFIVYILVSTYKKNRSKEEKK